MSASRRWYMRNTSYILHNWKDIRNAYMNELSEIPNPALEVN